MKELVISGDLAVDLAAVFDASPNPYVLIRPDLAIAGVNQAYLAATANSREAIIGRSLLESFAHGADEDASESVRAIRASIERTVETGQPDHLALLAIFVKRSGPDKGSSLERRLWSVTHTPVHDRDGALIYILQHATDVTDLERLRRAHVPITAPTALDVLAGGDLFLRAEKVQQANRELERERNLLLEMFMKAPGFVAVLNGPDHVFQMHNPAYSQLVGHRDVLGKSVRDSLPELQGQGYYERLDQVYATGEPYEGRENRVMLQRDPEADLEEVFLNFIYQPIRDDVDRVVGIFVQGHDVTQDVLAAQRQKLMIDELNHRVKNTLVTVQSIAVQTARSTTDPRSFARGFQERLMALSHTHDLLTRSHWEGAQLRQMLRHETKPYGPLRVMLDGPDMTLSPASAVSLGMVFHELATNAAKYGALSTPEGRVLIDWTTSGTVPPRLTLVWREIGGPSIETPAHRGFGMRLIERNIRHDLAGSFTFDYTPAGLVCEISATLDRALPPTDQVKEQADGS